MRHRNTSQAGGANALSQRQGAAGSPSLVLIAFAALALTAGVLVYAVDRSGPHVLPLAGVAASFAAPLFGSLGHWLPSFVHPFAFSLLSAAARPSAAKARVVRPAYGACFAWWLVNVAFEAGQHPAVSTTLAQFIDRMLGDGGPARWLANYFMFGTFDVLDIVAATAGAGAAAAVLRVVHERERGHGR